MLKVVEESTEKYGSMLARASVNFEIDNEVVMEAVKQHKNVVCLQP